MPPYVNVAWGKFYWRDFLLVRLARLLAVALVLAVACAAIAMCLECVEQKA